MLFKNLQFKQGVTLEVTLAEAHLPVKLGHRDAGKLFGEPLSQQLAAAGLGVLTECQTRDGPSGQINGVNLYLGLTNPSRQALETVAKMLDHLKAPFGSSIRLTEGLSDPLVFGVTEGLELSITTSAAPDAEARKDLVMTCRDAMEDLAVSRGWVQRLDRTEFYFYGESFSEMQERLTGILSDHPRFGSAITRRLA